MLTVFLIIMAILTWLAWWQKAYLALPFFLVTATAVTYLIVTFQVLVPFYQYRSAQTLTSLANQGPVYFFEEYRTSYPYYTGHPAPARCRLGQETRLADRGRSSGIDQTDPASVPDDRRPGREI